MKFKILGSGASMGVPVIGCNCSVCTSNNPRNQRLRCSALITTPAGKNILIDTSPDLREQLITHQITRVDAVYITHCHFDHVEGLNELRPLNFKTKIPIKLFIHESHWPSLKERFGYIFEPNDDYPGAPPVLFEIETFKSYQKLEIFDLSLQTLWVGHGNIEVAGFVCEDFAYIPDCSFFATKDRELLNQIEHLVIDGIWPKLISKNHFNIEQSIALGEEVGAKNIYLTHLSHLVDYDQKNQYESKSIKLCYDGMEIK